ncbi:MAG: hypothetical protein M1827_003975 [Pycnora praestabilis]|nr:MAG: hypothetical protein M1827_003975 [Pycnora praestabilis]
MGQSISSQREESSRRDSGRHAQCASEQRRASGPRPEQEGEASSNAMEAAGWNGSVRENTLQPRNLNAEIHESPSSAGIALDTTRFSQTIAGVESLSERPLSFVPGTETSFPGISGNPITTISASPMPRRASYWSRFGARLMPRYIASGSADDNDDRQRGGRMSRRRLSDLISTDQRQPSGDTTRRLSMFGLTSSSSGRGSTRPSSARRRRVTSISRPIPLSSGNWPSQERMTLPPLQGFNPVEPPTSATGPIASIAPDLGRRSSRLSRVRRSLSIPFPSIFSSSTNESSDAHHVNTFAPRRPSRVAFAESPDSFLPELNMPEMTYQFSPYSSSRSGPNRSRSRSISPDRVPFNESDLRRIPNALRGRPTRLRRGEDQAAMLSRLLSVAAAATAASLVGDTERALSEAQDVGRDGAEGSFDGFLRALQNGRLAAALRNGGSEMGGGTVGPSPDGNLAPLNFFRMFRFGTSTNNSGESSGSVTPTPDAEDNQESHEGRSNANESGDEGSDGRMVPVIIVGIRSVTPSNGSERDDGTATPPFLDALTSLPMPTGLSGANGPGRLMHRPEGISRFSHRRRASMGAVNGFPANYDSQRHHRTSGLGRPLSEAVPMSGLALPSVLSDTPPGPHPPPSTPADPGLSAYSSGTTTPSRRPSTSSAAFPSPRHESSARRPVGADLETTAEDPTTHARTARHRRLSDSEYPRHDFGSGAARRNGVVEPDNRPSEGSRSWIIYVLGGSYPENHPILTTPSLFTDSPTYEDMLLLSSLIGPAKPPVASTEDVAAASGVLRIVATSGGLIANAVDGTESVQIAPGERCLVCLADYEIMDEVRQLEKCKHLYHRECIDMWLTTGRNSCPLCRGQGVDEKTEHLQRDEELPSIPGLGTAGN